MSDLISVDFAIPVDRIAQATTDDLKQLLTRGLTITAKQLAYLAMVWRELENRGVDLSELRSGLAVYLPLIATERLEPELVVRFAGQRTLLTRLMELPISQQRKLLEDEATVTVVTIAGDGVPKTEQKPLTALSSHEAIRVFQGGKIINPAQQAAKLTASKPRTKQGLRLARAVKVEQRGDDTVLNVGGRLARMERVVDALAEFYGVDLRAAIEKGGGSTSQS